MHDIVVKVFNSNFRAVLASGLKITAEVKRRFEINDTDLLEKTHLIISGGLLLNGLYDGETNLKLAAQHHTGKNSQCRLYSEVMKGQALRAYGIKEALEYDFDGFFNVKRQIEGSIQWSSSIMALKDKSKGLTSADLQAYLENSDQIKSFVHVSSSFSSSLE